MEFPVYSTDIKRTTIKLTNDSKVTLAAEKTEYPFAQFKKIKRTTAKNYVIIRPCRDRKRLDVIFGRQADKAIHSHYAYAAQARQVFVRNVGGTMVERTLAFSGETGAFVPLHDEIRDSITNTTLRLTFALLNNEIVITDVAFTDGSDAG